MPIVAIEERTLRQRCARCERERELSLEELTPPDGKPPEVLTLPPCACGAVEHLIHAPDGEPEHPEPGSFGHLHRLLVDGLLGALHEAAPREDTLRENTLRARVERRIPEPVRERWFSAGPRLEVARDAAR